MYKLRLGFHATFALKKEDLIKVLKVAKSEGLQYSTSVLSQKTGLGMKKVTPMISWLTRGGLLCNRQLTPEGFEVLKHDPYLESPVTDWLIHFYLSFGNLPRQPLFLNPMPNDIFDLGGWSYFIFEFLPKHAHFSLDELAEKSSRIFSVHSVKHIRNNFKILLRAYTDSYALASCQIIKKVDSNTYATSTPTLPNNYIAAYMFSKLWERDVLHSETMALERLLDKRFGFLEVLASPDKSLWSHLEAMEKLKVISIHSEKPIQIRRSWSHPISLLYNAYQV